MVRFFKGKPLVVGGLRFTIDPLLPVVMVVLAWLLSERYYPQLIDFEPPRVYWVIGVTSTLLLIFSIIIHELGHAIAARKLNVPIERIHLFLFGGMAELRHRPLRPSDELLISLSGPMASLIFALLLWPLMLLVKPYFFVEYHVIQFILYVNVLLALFNMIPVYPLDGGRSLRALYWKFTDNYYRSSVKMYRTGAIIIGLILLGGIVDYMLFDNEWSVWIGLLALYLAYTAYTGRDELILMPGLQDLVLNIDPDLGPEQIVERLKLREDSFLERSIVPVMAFERFTAVIYGSDIPSKSSGISDLAHLHRSPMLGDYVEITDETSFMKEVHFKAEYIPVFNNGILKGICNANELRFWLLEHHRNQDIFLT
ncbi:MAG: site-2 protease family protein [Rhodothermaceae bacterium]|nr:site-2 protease family protein [Rhodothermaceae bacterium]